MRWGRRSQRSGIGATVWAESGHCRNAHNPGLGPRTRLRCTHAGSAPGNAKSPGQHGTGLFAGWPAAGQTGQNRRERLPRITWLARRLAGWQRQQQRRRQPCRQRPCQRRCWRKQRCWQRRWRNWQRRWQQRQRQQRRLQPGQVQARPPRQALPLERAPPPQVALPSCHKRPGRQQRSTKPERGICSFQIFLGKKTKKTD